MRLEPLVYVVDNDQAMLESLTWLIESVNLRVRTYKCTQKFLAESAPSPECASTVARGYSPGIPGSPISLPYLNEGMNAIENQLQ